MQTDLRPISLLFRWLFYGKSAFNIIVHQFNCIILFWLLITADSMRKAKSPLPHGLAKQRKSSAMEVMQYRMYSRMLRRDKPQAYLYGEYETVKGLGTFLSGMGISPARQISAHSLAPLENAEDGISYLPAEKDRIILLRALHRTLVLADDTSRRLMDADNTFIRIAMPLIDSAQVAVHMPLMGNRGADMIMETVEAYFNTLR